VNAIASNVGPRSIDDARGVDAASLGGAGGGLEGTSETIFGELPQEKDKRTRQGKRRTGDL
jgi:hypothetical protein